jgi:hypothetical protein
MLKIDFVNGMERAHVDAPGFGFLARKGRGYVFEPA